MNVASKRKFLAAAGLGAAEVAAYIVANPKDLPSWLVGAALAVNAGAVYWVRNAQAPPVGKT